MDPRGTPNGPPEVRPEAGPETRAETRAETQARLQLPGGRRAGAHLPHPRGLLAAADRAAEIGATAMQIFVDNPTSWRRRGAPPPRVDEFRSRLAEHDIEPLAVHAAYLINLAGHNEEFYGHSIDLLASELEAAGTLGARYVNVHVGSHRGAGVDAGIGRVVDGIEQVLDGRGDLPAVLVFENGSGGGDGIGGTLEELAALLELAGTRGVEGSIGFCLDAAHLWGAGYDISQPAGVDTVVTRFDQLIGLERLRMIHLNDSVSALGSRHDRHTHVGAGEIGAAGLGRLLLHPSLDHVAYYVETPFMEEGFDAVNLGRMADIAAGRDLRPLPPEPEHPARRARFVSFEEAI